MSSERLPLRDPRTVARDIPGVLNILFPRLSGGLVASLNRKSFHFNSIAALPDALVQASQLQHSMLFELSVARAEKILAGVVVPDWQACLRTAINRQQRHFDARIPSELFESDMKLADWAAQNLVLMLRSVMDQQPTHKLVQSPFIPGLGWISSGHGDFALGPILIEIKHTNRNFVANDFRQVLIYWILKYAEYLENDKEIWSKCLLLNPRRNSALLVDFDYLLKSASPGLNRIELYQLLRSIVGHDTDRTQ
jgi:hypothetical protein